ncbi:TDP43_N domain-containing protein [Meloidogyne graminicola]|uniref:TDP43_N domain-containing protein n=1 Tax=Meloidogyne graminicola TaxID=189291 RepID=A0A8S9ZLL2_9BILA|nr:TDP43_N domain-containing protein [Meloidogyne graminicola]
MTDKYVLVVCEDEKKSIYLPLEKDDKLALFTVCAKFPNVSSLKFKNPSDDAYRQIRFEHGFFISPSNGWPDKVYIVLKSGPEPSYGLLHIQSEIAYIREILKTLATKDDLKSIIDETKASLEKRTGCSIVHRGRVRYSNYISFDSS